MVVFWRFSLATGLVRTYAVADLLAYGISCVTSKVALESNLQPEAGNPVAEFGFISAGNENPVFRRDRTKYQFWPQLTDSVITHQPFDLERPIL